MELHLTTGVVAHTTKIWENCCSMMAARLILAVRKELNEIEKFHT